MIQKLEAAADLLVSLQNTYLSKVSIDAAHVSCLLFARAVLLRSELLFESSTPFFCFLSL